MKYFHCRDGRGHLGHFIAGGDQTVDAVVPAGAFPDGIDIRIGVWHIVDHDAAALGDRQPALGGQLIARRIPLKTMKSTCSSLPSAKCMVLRASVPSLNNLFGVLLV